MRQEATLTQWKELYEAGDRLKRQKPWDKVPFDGIFAVQRTRDPEDTIFMRILCEEGKHGLSVYKGYQGLVSMMMLFVGDLIRVPFAYIAHSQNSLNVQWCTKDNLNEEQTERIKELSIRYRGEGYQGFIRYEQGYYPDALEQDDVVLMTECLKAYSEMLAYYTKHKDEIAFEEGVMLLKKQDPNGDGCIYETVQVPFDGCFCEDNGIRDAETIEKLKKCHRNIHTYRVDAHPVNMRVPMGDRDGFPMMIGILDVSEDSVLSMKAADPEKDENREILNRTIDAVLKNGIPARIYADNIVIKEALRSLCEICGIRLSLTPVEKGKEKTPAILN